jgi:hypothetical protein
LGPAVAYFRTDVFPDFLVCSRSLISGDAATPSSEEIKNYGASALNSRFGSAIYMTRLQRHETPDPGIRPSNPQQLRRSKTLICRADST